MTTTEEPTSEQLKLNSKQLIIVTMLCRNWSLRPKFKLFSHRMILSQENLAHNLWKQYSNHSLVYTAFRSLLLT